MNKKSNDTFIRIFVYSATILIVCVIVCSKQIFNGFNIKIAESCFNSQDYICAFKHYQKAFHSDINNKKYVNHYFQVLKKMKKIAIIQQELYNLTILYPDSSLQKDTEAIFAEIKKRIENDYPETYIYNVVQGTSIVHWNITNGPLTVCITNSQNINLPEYYKTEVKNAFVDYQSITDNQLKFRFVQSPDEANIIIDFTENISNGKSDNASKILGLTENDTQGGILRKSTVSLKTKDIDGTDFTENQIHNIAKHEIGHALGITGHSYYIDDVMYPVNNDAKLNNNTVYISRKNFSSRDIQTLKLLYNIIPDITNKEYSVQDVPDMVMPIAVLGTKEQIGEKKLEEASTYVNTVSNSFVSQMNLAEGYFANNDSENALNAFINAMKMAKTNDEKFAVYHNIAVIYYQQNDTDNAIKYAEMANIYSDFSKGKTSDEILAYCYFEQKRYHDAQVLLDKVIEINPNSAIVSATLATSYIKQFKIFDTIKEMKRIKKENSAALNEDCYSGLSFFKIFI